LPPSEAGALDGAGFGVGSGGDLLASVTALALRAGAAILKIYTGPEIAASAKADGSPVTAADEAAEAAILDGLAELAPGVPVVAEEAVGRSGPPEVDGGRFWLVDPLDGTKEFLNRNGEFTVNIALIDANRPVLGVVHAPALAETYAGLVGAGAWHTDAEGERRPVAARAPGADGLVVVASRSHGDTGALDRFLEGRVVAGRRQVGSSLKFCLVAAGEADVYPRFGRTMEWDTAAGHAVLAAAGGRVVTLDGAPLTYGKDGFDNPHFVAWGRP